jgi:uncharacterized protein involved in exopolysaccharide biosynthesis
MTTIDVTTEILQQIRTDIRELRDDLRAEIREVRTSLEGRIDGLDSRVGVVEFALRGMATDIHTMARLLRQVADEVADHGGRLDRLERDR